jgi:hypothetical protein
VTDSVQKFAPALLARRAQPLASGGFGEKAIRLVAEGRGGDQVRGLRGILKEHVVLLAWILTCVGRTGPRGDCYWSQSFLKILLRDNFLVQSPALLGGSHDRVVPLAINELVAAGTGILGIGS